MSHITWRPQEPTVFVVMRKQDGRIVGRYESKACFSFHHINAFECAGEIVLDLAASADAAIIEEGNMLNLRKGMKAGQRHAQSEFRWYHLPLSISSAIATFERISDHSLELPTINYARCCFCQ